MKLSHINTYFAFGLAIVIGFGAFSLVPSLAHADYSYPYGYYNNQYGAAMYTGPYGSDIGNRYGYGTTYNTYQTPYPYPYQYYNPLSVSCTANTNSVNVGQSVIWSASVSGGNGSYNFSWSGSDGLTGYGQSIAVPYNNPGSKIASVTVNSNGQTITQSCNTAVYVNGYYYGQYQTQYQNQYYYQNSYPTYQQQTVYQQPVYQTSNYNGLDIGCYADPTSATVNQPVTWTVEVTGGVAPYTYSWTGSDGLTGSAATAIKYYSTKGVKSAIVTVSTADGKSGTHACSNTVTVGTEYRSAYHASYKAPTASVTPTPSPSLSSGQSAAALLSLENIPWGWVAVLIILILFATVLYLLFNKQKI